MQLTCDPKIPRYLETAWSVGVGVSLGVCVCVEGRETVLVLKAPGHSRVGLVDDHHLGVDQDPAPVGMVREDGGVQCVRICEDDVGVLPNVLAVRPVRVTIKGGTDDTVAEPAAAQVPGRCKEKNASPRARVCV